DFGFPGDTSEPVMVSLVTLDKKRGRSDLAAPGAKGPSKPSEINKPATRRPSVTRETVRASASDTGETHIESHPSASSPLDLEPAAAASARGAASAHVARSSRGNPRSASAGTALSPLDVAHANPNPQPSRSTRKSR